MTDVQLKIVDGPDTGREFPIGGSLVIGRDPSAGIVLEDTEVSRRHAQVAPRSSGMVIEDLGSTNGTFVNGEQIEGERSLHGGEKVRIGTTVLEVSVPIQATKIASVIPEEPDPGATKMASVMSPDEAEAAVEAEQSAAQPEDDEATVVPEAAEPAPSGTEAPSTQAPSTEAPATAEQPAAAPAPAPPPPPPSFAPPPPPPPPSPSPVGGPQAPLPAQAGHVQPPAGHQAGPGFQVRGPGEQWALCALVPFYSLIWYYRLCKEIGEWSQGRIHTSPGTSIVAMTLGAIVIVPPFVSIAGTMGRIRQCQQMAGLQPQASFWGFIGRLLLVGYGYKWLTEQLNELAVRRPLQ